MSLIAPLIAGLMMSQETFSIGPDSFLLNGKPFVIRSGEIHFARVPREYWRHRLKMTRAAGFNTVCCYLFWNFIEREPGKFDWSGAADAAEFCSEAQQEGLKVILRPGPYSCAEWELGGMPWWLLKDDTLKVRTQHQHYMEASRRYLLEVGKQLAPLQITKGGPIIMVQVENEYGSFGSDKEYIGKIRDNLVDAGFHVPLFTCDGPSQLKNDTRDDIFSVVNFGGDPQGCFAELRKIRSTGPLMCGEFYPGWFDSWGGNHHRGSDKGMLDDLSYMLENKASFSMYMVHGGTSFAWWSGANAMPYRPQTSSYDYDAPIMENGDPAPKFAKVRDLFSKHLNPGETVPPIPAKIPTQAIKPFELVKVAPLEKLFGKPVMTGDLTTMEALDQGYGMIRYRRMLPIGPAALLRFDDVHDYALVKLGGKLIGTINRLKGEKAIQVPARTKPTQIDIMVEAMGRVNYGGHMHDRKGLHGPATLITNGEELALVGWEHSLMPFAEYKMPPSRKNHLYSVDAPKVKVGPGAGMYAGTFNASSKADTYIDVSNCNKGLVWVNGHCLGRFWNIGPTQTMYCPGVWLQDSNYVEILDLGDKIGSVQGLARPILDKKVGSLTQMHRKQGQEIGIAGIEPVAEGEFPGTRERHTVKFAPVMAKQICLEALNSHKNEAYASLAELQILDADGKPIPRELIRVAFADSEEVDGDDGSASNVLDGDGSTIWHTQWSGAAPQFPHYLVVTLVKPQKVTGIVTFPRPNNGDQPGNGAIKGFRVFVGESLIKGPQ